MEELFSVAREASEPRLWSLAVELARTCDFVEQPSGDPEETVVRIVRGRSDKVVTVTLSEVNTSWQCDCQDAEDPCQHVVAAIIALRQGKVSKGILRSSGGAVGNVVHEFTRAGSHLSFGRRLVWGDASFPFEGPLQSALDSIGKGRGAVVVTREEHQIDHVLPVKKAGIFDPKTMGFLLKALARVENVEFDGKKVAIAEKAMAVAVEVVDDGDGFRIRRKAIEGCEEIFDNGVALISGALCGVRDDGLSSELVAAVKGEGARYPLFDAIRLATHTIPALEKSVRVEVHSRRIPRARRVEPRAVIETFGDERGDGITALARIVYGDPILAEVFGEAIEYQPSDMVPIREQALERALQRKIVNELNLKPKEAKVFRGEEAVRFTEKLKGWETKGEGTASFIPARSLDLHFDDAGELLSVRFETPEGGAVAGDEVLRAWRQGSSFIRLNDGGWGAVPRTWLQEHRDALERILSAASHPRAVKARLLPDVAELCASSGMEVPEYFSRLLEGLERRGERGEVALPTGTTATLRSYQEDGVRWLSFLRSNGLGALLADDMGLGKTLQTISVIKGRTLVVCPTSVLHGWEREIIRFRPDLRVARYHGGRRALDQHVDVTLTSYAIMRLDIDLLSDVPWEMVVLDESQHIKNPESQVAQAAYRLQGDFKVSLSGTPVENSLRDLWSQFHFLNPGLLGSRGDFVQRVERRIEEGDAHAAGKLKRRVAPFILRRLKRDVAKELPPKTEVVLECELSDEERRVYEALLGASREDLLGKLEAGDAVFTAMEALLRLRQACCHLGLLPGYQTASSSKMELLLESLGASISQGHRALVFSQWTSLLDLVEPRLEAAGISFARIDGGTADRGAIVDGFQAADGPSVLLLSLKAGGVGLNLTAADHVYILDPWWNPATEDQAADRAYRIGQENPVLVHRLVARGTVEERILELQERKRALLEAAVGEGGQVGLTKEDILSLLRSDNA